MVPGAVLKEVVRLEPASKPRRALPTRRFWQADCGPAMGHSDTSKATLQGQQLPVGSQVHGGLQGGSTAAPRFQHLAPASCIETASSWRCRRAGWDRKHPRTHTVAVVAHTASTAQHRRTMLACTLQQQLGLGAHQAPPLTGGRVGGTTCTSTWVGLSGLPVLSGALAAGVTNDRLLLGGEALAPVKPTTKTSYLSRGRVHWVGLT